jgi:4-amino-4-deoxy-L-arabinose transferase-like glycosyltransferase
VKRQLPLITLIAIMLLSAVLHFWKIGDIGDSNAYYTAAVESMTQSWHNFFYAAAEPGGSVTVDKPPLGLQVETLFAIVLGVSGFSTSLPNILAGIFSVPLIYHLVKKHSGATAGLVAALIIATTPVVFAADRNNTQDGLLTFFLLLAAWAFIKAMETGRARWLFLGAIIVGLGFNIKMLQAYLPVPAFFAFYFLGARSGWLKKLGRSLEALAVMAAVSLSWALYVDSVPVEARPYIGSTQENSVIELVLGHNGVSRLFSGSMQDGQPPRARLQPAPGSDGPDGFSPYISPDNPPIPGLPQNSPPDGMYPQPGNPSQRPFSSETGTPGILRFFKPPLAMEMSWLLPFALFSLFSLFILLLHSRIKLPVESGAHLGLILWGGWLFTGIIFFSMISGIFHSYYVVMLAPPLAAMVGAGFATIWELSSAGKGITVWSLVLFVTVTVIYQVFLARVIDGKAAWLLFSFLLVILGAILFSVNRLRPSNRFLAGGFTMMLAALLFIPLVWSFLTVNQGTDRNLPAAYGVQGNNGPNLPAMRGGEKDNAGDEFIQFLAANTRRIRYLVAVPSSAVGAHLVLVTGRPVLYMGGFTGNDNVVSASDLADLVAKGELRYVLFTQQWDRPGISAWLQTSCTQVEQFRPRSTNGPMQMSNPGVIGLYDCR